MKNIIISVDKSYYFNAVVDAPLSLKMKVLREESVYDADINTELTALKYIKKISECIKENIYLIVTGSDVAPPNRLRTKKGALWGENELRSLDHRNLEVIIDGSDTRLISIVDLKSFTYSSPSKVLNWIDCMMVLSSLDLNSLAGMVGEWVSKNPKTILPYDHKSVSKDLCRLESTAILRYFPADNGKPESLVLVGHNNFLETKINPCITYL